jgi:hypothetical protein
LTINAKGSGTISIGSVSTGAVTLTPAVTLGSTLALGGTVSGGGNQINNVIIGTSTPLAGAFTTLTANTSVSSPIHSATGALTFQSNGSTFAGNINTSQQWTLGTNAAAPTGPVAVISKNANALPQAQFSGSPVTNVALHLGTADGSQGFMVFDNYGTANAPSLIFRSGRGTAASPTATQNGDNMLALYGQGYGTNAYAGFGAIIAASALENWTNTAQGSEIAFYTAAIGATAVAKRLAIDQGLVVGAATGGDKGSGSINISGAFYANGVAVAGTGTVTSITCGTGLSCTAANPITGSGTIAITSPVAASIGGTGVASPTAHTIPINEGASAQANTGTGTLGQALVSGGASADASFKSGAWVLLNTLSPSGVASISDTTSLTSSYNEYEIVFEGITTNTTSNTFEMLVHSGGSFPSTSYVTSALQWVPSSVAAVGQTTFIQLSNSSTWSNTKSLSGYLTVYAPSGTSVVKQWTGQTSAFCSNVCGTSIAAYWDSNAAIDGVQFQVASGTFSGTIKIYGRL